MQKIIIAGFILWLSTVLPVAAQKSIYPIPRWVSDKGYWVVQKDTDSCIVYFYNNDNQLVYRERVRSRLHVDRKRTKIWLTKELEQAVTAWENRNDPSKAIGRQNPSLYRQMMGGDPGLSGY